MNDPHPGMRTTTGIISKDAPQLHFPPPLPPTAEHPHTKINRGMNAEQLQYSLELELASMTKNENTLSGQFSFQHSRLKLHRLGLHHLRQTKVQLYGSDIPVQTITTQDGGKRWDKHFLQGWLMLAGNKKHWILEKHKMLPKILTLKWCCLHTVISYDDLNKFYTKWQIINFYLNFFLVFYIFFMMISITSTQSGISLIFTWIFLVFYIFFMLSLW